MYQLLYSFSIILHSPMMKDTSEIIYLIEFNASVALIHLDLIHLESTNLAFQHTLLLLKTPRTFLNSELKKKREEGTTLQAE